VPLGQPAEGGQSVPPGSGWPEDPAAPGTPVATDAAEVRALAAEAAAAGNLGELTARQSVCRACPRLVSWREQVAAVKRPSSRTQRYWGRPVPGWGDEQARLLILGLAPAAHGGNRTGRIFTGDRSGDVLFASLHRCGLATLPTSTAAGDGQRLTGARMVAAVRCAPPVNKPSVTERDTCAPWLTAEFALVAPTVRVIVCLGGFAWQAAWPMLRAVGFALPRPRPKFGHGTEVMLTAPVRSASGVPSAGCGSVPPAGADGPSGADGAGASGAAGPGGADSAGGAGGAGGASGAGGAGGKDGSGGQALLLGCYHPSQQNTFTGRVTPAMLDAVFGRACRAAGIGHVPAGG
jgi:uracil-DNA glycosylase